jgi:hypothetical protein
MFHGFDYSQFETRALQLLPGAMNHLLALQGANGELNGKKRFLDAMAALTRATRQQYAGRGQPAQKGNCLFKCSEASHHEIHDD